MRVDPPAAPDTTDALTPDPPDARSLADLGRQEATGTFNIGQ